DLTGGVLPFGEAIYGRADGDRNKSYLEEFLDSTRDDLPLVAVQWALAEGLNNSVSNSGRIAVAINFNWGQAMTPFSTYVANTVSHELAHTFGLLDAYTSAGDGGAAMCISGNCIPFDLMRAGSIVDPDLSFLPANTTLLQLALGIQPNNANLT